MKCCVLTSQWSSENLGFYTKNGNAGNLKEEKMDPAMKKKNGGDIYKLTRECLKFDIQDVTLGGVNVLYRSRVQLCCE